jgi:hypothetical protein
MWRGKGPRWSIEDVEKLADGLNRTYYKSLEFAQITPIPIEGIAKHYFGSSI